MAAREPAVKLDMAEIVAVTAPQAPMRREHRPDAALETEALKGELVRAIERNASGWTFGELLTDGYRGWLPTSALAARGSEPTHKVAALRTFAFPDRSIKSPPVEAIPFGGRLAVVRVEERMAVTESGTYVPAAHLAPIALHERDFVAVAERFIGVPYLWGGKTSLGLDCSGLVQIAFAACGIDCPRDSHLQERAVGEAVAPDQARSPLKRGDLIFWNGHVGIMRDPATLLHANAFHMAVASEPVTEAIARIRQAGSEVTSIRRITPGAARPA
jgi:cell wall-associated NlpC family hydrolase